MMDAGWFGIGWFEVVIVVVCFLIPLTIASLFLRRLWKYLGRR